MSSAQAASQVERSKIWRMGLLAVAASVVANLAALFILRAILELPSAADFPPLSVGAIGGLTAVFTLIGVGIFAVLAGRVNNPARTFWIIATVAVILISIPNVISALDPTAVPFPFPAPSALGFLVLIVFHVIAYLITTWVLTTKTRV